MTRTAPLSLLALVIAGCSPMAADKGGRETSVATVRRQALTGYTFFDGKLVVPASASAVTTSPYSTQVVEVYTVAGKEVEKGQAIAKLDIPGTDSAKAAAKAQTQSAGAAYSAELADKSGPVRDAKKALDEARAVEKTARDVVAGGGEADIDAAVQARMDAERTLAEAQRERDEQLRPAKDSVASARSTLAAVREAERKGLILAPISGTVVSLEAKPGMSATSNQALATVVDFRQVRVQGFLPAELKDKVKKGTDVLVAFNGVSSDPVDGEVLDVSVAPPKEGQASGVYLAVIAFKNPGALVQPGATVKRVGVKSGYVEDALVVPATAVHGEGTDLWVEVKEDSTWSKRRVTLGITDGALVQIVSGLKDGEQVKVESPPAPATRA
ncbi:MAG: HlyD family efflux transporter periplasmic adaptor subunit [Armatimonadetes bacterium]|nr:HlyD family efflux transporter periplasmic adaptor subunit [Armatimonadota bacterium]